MKKMYLLTVVIIGIITLIFIFYYTDENAIASELLSSYGYETADGIFSQEIFTLPQNFDKTMDDYNIIQMSQGYNLLPFKEKKCKKYTYKITNVPYPLFANIMFYRGKVISADILNPDLNGFILPLIHIKDLTKYQIPAKNEAVIP